MWLTDWLSAIFGNDTKPSLTSVVTDPTLNDLGLLLQQGLAVDIRDNTTGQFGKHWAVPQNRMWIVYGCTLLNANRAARAYAYISKRAALFPAITGDYFVTEARDALGADRAVSALGNVKLPLLLDSGDGIACRDSAWQAGDNLYGFIYYYEVIK